MGVSSTLRSERPIRSEPKRGQMIPVRVATHATGTLLFKSGAIVTITISFDVPKHAHTPIEIYGTDASMLVPDPNKFGGEVKIARPRAPEWEIVSVTEPYADGNYRSLGLVDMAMAIVEDKAHRASGELALHVLEVLEAFEVSSRTGEFVNVTSTLERPAPLSHALWTSRAPVEIGWTRASCSPDLDSVAADRATNLHPPMPRGRTNGSRPNSCSVRSQQT
jgi:hypothetical protein